LNAPFHPKKRLGQHFLQDENIAKKIISSFKPKDGLILEIGPGTGSLTKFLLPLYNDSLWVVEADEEAVTHLSKTYPSLIPHIIHTDFLTLNLKEQFNKAPVNIIGNFPYNISSQIIFRALEYREYVPLICGMFQKEVAKRICSPPGNKDYGILSVLMQAFYLCEYLFDVGPAVFNPPPKVNSGFVRFIRKDNFHLQCNEELFFKVVKMGFNQRRKKLSNALSGMGKKAESELLIKRAEQLTWEEFVELTKLFEKES
jgi:16S rRNA (adenine1518-N6/adenine1519-N6)-dimethyltransferase